MVYLVVLLFLCILMSFGGLVHDVCILYLKYKYVNKEEYEENNISVRYYLSKSSYKIFDIFVMLLISPWWVVYGLILIIYSFFNLTVYTKNKESSM
ncbi:hypothetical protein ABE82_26115 (plasmid) [Paenibacillus peoriae]|nr:hypothetical protein ABE82_26115 [Paenibacillus peoriae]